MVIRVAIILLFAVAVALAQPVTGVVTHVRDGDTFLLRTAADSVAVRVYAVDCPERGAHFYRESKAFATALLLGNTVTVDTLYRDKYRRIVGAVTLADGRDRATELIRAGMAWHALKYNRNPSLDSLQCIARESGAGLWAELP